MNIAIKARKLSTEIEPEPKQVGWQLRAQSHFVSTSTDGSQSNSVSTYPTTILAQSQQRRIATSVKKPIPSLSLSGVAVDSLSLSLFSSFASRPLSRPFHLCGANKDQQHNEDFHPSPPLLLCLLSCCHTKRLPTWTAPGDADDVNDVDDDDNTVALLPVSDGSLQSFTCIINAATPTLYAISLLSTILAYSTFQIIYSIYCYSIIFKLLLIIIKFISN